MNKSFYPIAYACYNKNLQIRLDSTSGGIFTILGNYIIQNLHGIVYGATFSEDYKKVIHIGVDNVSDLKRLRGSKYPQSLAGTVFKDVEKRLKNDQYVLFTGTPCQVEGLQCYLGKEYRKLICMDFVCHGVASGLIWSDYVEELLQNGQIIGVTFKSKPKGWKKWYFRVDYPDHVFQIRGRMNKFMKSYLSYCNIRPSCFSCYFKGLKRNSDFTISDCWGIGEENKLINDNNGLSALLIQNERAAQIFDEIKKNINYVEYPVEVLMEGNWTAIKSVAPNPKRGIFFKCVIENGGEYALNQFFNPTLREWIGYYKLRVWGKEK